MPHPFQRLAVLVCGCLLALVTGSAVAELLTDTVADYEQTQP